MKMIETWRDGTRHPDFLPIRITSLCAGTENGFAAKEVFENEAKTGQ